MKKEIEHYKKRRDALSIKYCNRAGAVDFIVHKMNDEDFLDYVDATVHFQEFSGDHPIGKMGYVLKDAIEERPVEYIERLADLLSQLSERKEAKMAVAIEFFAQFARLRGIERKYGVTGDEELEELPRKIKNQDDLESYFKAKAIQITSEGFYPRILDYGVEHGHISEEQRKDIDIERERFKPREKRTDFS